eukprot:2764070-Amphidinium_carterae.3
MLVCQKWGRCNCTGLDTRFIALALGNVTTWQDARAQIGHTFHCSCSLAEVVTLVPCSSRHLALSSGDREACTQLPPRNNGTLGQCGTLFASCLKHTGSMRFTGALINKATISKRELGATTRASVDAS